MLLLKVLSGNTAGSEMIARRFPFRVGRTGSADMALEGAGVWEGHFEIRLDDKEGFLLLARTEALTLVNGVPTQRRSLRNGDLIEAGDVKLQFWITPADQRSLLPREVLTWSGLGSLVLGEFALIYWLTH